MISVTSAQLDAWLVAFMFPLARILGVLATAPVFNNAALTPRNRLLLGLAISMALVPALPAMPTVPAGSWISLAILAQQMLIGLLIGFSLRVVFAAIDIAGELIGLQMGLSFAVLYDPQSAGNTPVITNFIALLTTLIFIASNGHLLIISMLAETFNLLPVTDRPFSAQSLYTVVASGSTLFAVGLLLALPVVASLLIANIGLGILARVAPQLNLFAVGFVVTIIAGMVVLTLSLPYLGFALQKLFEMCFLALEQFLRAAAHVS